jgi:hypothetical protein
MLLQLTLDPPGLPIPELDIPGTVIAGILRAVGKEADMACVSGNGVMRIWLSSD